MRNDGRGSFEPNHPFNVVSPQPGKSVEVWSMMMTLGCRRFGAPLPPSKPLRLRPHTAHLGPEAPVLGGGPPGSGMPHGFEDD